MKPDGAGNDLNGSIQQPMSTSMTRGGRLLAIANIMWTVELDVSSVTSLRDLRVLRELSPSIPGRHKLPVCLIFTRGRRHCNCAIANRLNTTALYEWFQRCVIERGGDSRAKIQHLADGGETPFLFSSAYLLDTSLITIEG